MSASHARPAPAHPVPPDRLEALLLDFDGVIADSMPMQEEAWREAAERCAPRAEVVEALVDNLYRGAAGQQMFEGVPVSAGERVRLRETKDAIWRDSWGRVPLAPGAAETLRRLPDSLPVGIATTAPRPYVELVLDSHDAAGLFDDIVTNDDVARPKPDPAMIERLLRGFGTEPESALMVGDTSTDARMSEAAGVAFVLLRLRPDGPEADSLAREPRVESWEELARLLTPAPAETPRG